MQICIAFLLVALGGGLYALHTKVCHRRECAAYNNGYNQAQKEHKIRQDAVAQMQAQMQAQMRPIVQPRVEERGEPIREVFPPEFMDKMHQNGRAVVRVNNHG